MEISRKYFWNAEISSLAGNGEKRKTLMKSGDVTIEPKTTKFYGEKQLFLENGKRRFLPL